VTRRFSLNRSLPVRPRSDGGALLLALMLLTGLTLLGLAAASDQALQMRIVGNLERSGQAEIAAHSALDWAEDWLFSLDGSAPPAVCPDPCDGAVLSSVSTWPEHPDRADTDWWLAQGHLAGTLPVDGSPLLEYSPSNPGRWIISAIDVPAPPAGDLPAPVIGWFHIMARGADTSGRQVAVIESVVARPWGESSWRDPLPRPAGQPRFCQASGPHPCGRMAWRQLR